METTSGVAAQRDVVETVEANGRQPRATCQRAHAEGAFVIVQMVDDGVGELQRQPHVR